MPVTCLLLAAAVAAPPRVTTDARPGAEVPVTELAKYRGHGPWPGRAAWAEPQADPALLFPASVRPGEFVRGLYRPWPGPPAGASADEWRQWFFTLRFPPPHRLRSVIAPYPPVAPGFVSAVGS